MDKPHTGINPAPDPGSYRIRTQGRLKPRWSTWPDGRSGTRDDDGTTEAATPMSRPRRSVSAWPVVQQSRRRGDGPRLVIAVLAAAAVLVAAVLILGPDGLIPFGLLLVLSADPDDDNGRRAVILSRRNLGVAAVMALAFAWFWLWHVRPDRVDAGADRRRTDRPAARPCRTPPVTPLRRRTVAITKRSLVLAMWGLVVFVNLTYAYGQSWNMLAAACLVLPLVLAASRAWSARRGRLELGLLRHPHRREAATPPGAGTQHLVVLRTPRWRGGRRRHPLRQDRALPERN